MSVTWITYEELRKLLYECFAGLSSRDGWLIHFLPFGDWRNVERKRHDGFVLSYAFVRDLPALAPRKLPGDFLIVRNADRIKYSYAMPTNSAPSIVSSAGCRDEIMAIVSMLCADERGVRSEVIATILS
jgi:hypothetical protein